jgi:hypothetical protein
MTRWTRINLVLATLAAGMLLAVNWPDDADTARLTDLAAATIDRVRVERGNRLVLTMQRRGDGWHISHPVDQAARPGRVAQLLALAEAPVAHCQPLAERAAAFGLERPGAVVQLDHQRIAFGDRDATRRARYVALNDRVCIVDDIWFNLASLPVTHFTSD